jgi:acetyl/propionyl-CoA carboxylase alpha subunit
MVTGLDLLREQIRIASGEPLDPALENLEPVGHAIEVRLYAEDPYRGFAPSPGRIEQLRWPDGPGVRVDSGVYEGSEVSIFYDSLLAKLIVWGADRPQALARLGRALSEMRIEGIHTTKPLFQALVKDQDFVDGALDIGMLDRRLEAGELRPPEASAHHDLPLLAAAIEHAGRSSRRAAAASVAGGRRGNWRRAGRRESVEGGR